MVLTIWLDEIGERLCAVAELRQCQQDDRQRGRDRDQDCQSYEFSIGSLIMPSLPLDRTLRPDQEARLIIYFPDHRAGMICWFRRGDVDWRKITGQFFTGIARLGFLPDADSVATASGAERRNRRGNVAVHRMR